jgi:hypothetical protein
MGDLRAVHVDLCECRCVRRLELCDVGLHCADTPICRLGHLLQPGRFMLQPPTHVSHVCTQGELSGLVVRLHTRAKRHKTSACGSGCS